MRLWFNFAFWRVWPPETGYTMAWNGRSLWVIQWLFFEFGIPAFWRRVTRRKP